MSVNLPDNKTRVTVNIFGEEYTLRGSGDPDVIRDIAQRVDDKLHTLSETYVNLGRTRLAILAALHFSEEIEKLKEQLAEVRMELQVGRLDEGDVSVHDSSQKETPQEEARSLELPRGGSHQPIDTKQHTDPSPTTISTLREEASVAAEAPATPMGEPNLPKSQHVQGEGRRGHEEGVSHAVDPPALPDRSTPVETSTADERSESDGISRKETSTDTEATEQHKEHDMNEAWEDTGSKYPYGLLFGEEIDSKGLEPWNLHTRIFPPPDEEEQDR